MASDNSFQDYLSSLTVKSSGGKVGRPRTVHADGAQSETSERKTSVYFGGTTLEEIRQVAAKCDRSVSWVLSKSFELAREQLESMSVSNPE